MPTVSPIALERGDHPPSDLFGPMANGAQPDFRVYTEDRVEIGGGWNRVGKNSGNPYVSLTFAAPEFGPNKIYANLGRAAGQDNDDNLAILWNPRD